MKFKAEQFISTKWDTAEQKAKFANQFVRFIESDFAASHFPKWFYQRLSNCFGHIAHYDQSGFYGTFFETSIGRVRFAEIILNGGGYGDPTFTYSDVERALKTWAIDYELLNKMKKRLNEETRRHERIEYARLKQKYGGEK